MAEILHTVSGIWEHSGGPAESVPGLCGALSDIGLRIRLMTLAGRLSAAAMESRLHGVEIETFPWFGREFSLAFGRAIRHACRSADLVHGHGLWLHVNWVTGSAARKEKKPLVITPRGLLEPAALAHSRWRKRIAGALFDNGYLRRAHCLHACSEKEYESVRRYGLRNPVAILCNGISPRFRETLPKKDIIINKFPELENKSTVLFLSRLSWEKGLLQLAEAWKGLSGSFDEWHLLIGGSGEPSFEERIKARFEKMGLSRRVTWAGRLTGDERLAAFSLADLLVLPTVSESFGMVVAEALAAGVPVITTHGAPWKALVEERCGWWVPVDGSALLEAMEEAMTLSDEARQEMGARGKSLVAERCTWNRIAEKMASVYSWILGGGVPPDCVRTD